MPGKSCFTKLLLILVILSLLAVLTGQSRQLMLSEKGSQTTLTELNDFGFSILYSVGSLELEPIQTKGGDFTRLSIEGYGLSQRIGEPGLPSSNRIIAVPLGAKVSFDILRKEEISISREESRLQSRIMPTQAPVSKSADSSQIVFDFNGGLYRKNSLLGTELFRAEEIGILRGVRLFSISFEPVRYNPVTAELQVCLQAEIKVNFAQPDLAATRELRERTASHEFEQLYAKTIFNWNPDRASLVRQPTKMLILCPPAYVGTMQTYVDWKRKQGYIVNLVTVGSGATVANNVSAIQSYMQGLWNSATTGNPAPTYLIIVGDHGTSGNNITAATGVTGSHITDFSYVRLNGSDYLPEMYHGRFSVSNSTELQNVINKTLMFSQSSMPDLSYLGKTVLIAGVDASWAPTHGNGAINYATAHYINSAHGITSNNYLYPASESSASQIRANAAEGRSYLNYTAHGSETSWGNPLFNSGHMTNLTNVNKPFLAVGNCCITNKFDYSSPCFGEAIIRAPNAGAAYIGGINNTYWNEDYYWAVGYKTPQTAAHAYDPTRLGAYDASFHAPGNVADWASTTGETVFMGNMAVQQSGSSRRDYYWEIYHIMGDPSLMPYYGVPTVNTATFPPAIMPGLDNITVTAEAYSRVALSRDGILYATGIVPASGSLNLSFTPFSTVGDADLVITASGKITRTETIQVLPASGPFMTVEDISYADSNNNQPDYNESGRFHATFKNIGTAAASNVTATLTTTTAGITFIDDTETFGTFGAGATIIRNNAFVFNIADNVADATVASFTITLVSGSNTWMHEFNLILNAPALSFGTISISDPSGNNNGRIDPGETVTLTLPLANIGGAASLPGSISLSSPTSGITINTATVSFAAISAAGSQNLSFSITAASWMSPGTIADFSFHAIAGAYSASQNQSLEVGVPPEVIIGSGSSSTSTTTASPINVYYQSSHGQTVYTAAELNAAGLAGSAMITGLGFNVTGLPAHAMPNYIVRMAATSATNVSSWIQTGLETVFTAASYQPTATGWNMMMLDTPFEWNGTDNILVDTAFGLIGGWNSSGTVEYTSVANAYRFVRSDSNDQTNVFSSGSTSSYRPNLKLVFQPIAANEARIFTNPASLSYDDTPVGQSSSQSLRISNSGGIALTGSISTPTGFSINQRSDELSSKAERNTINFSIPANSFRDYAAVFSPTSAANYSGNIAITSNAANSPALNIPVSGTGYLPPTIAVNTDAVSAILLIGEQGSDSFTITNTGSQELSFNIALTPVRNQLTEDNSNRSIAGSSLSVAPDSYQSGTTVDWEISTHNSSTDTEWIKEVILDIPAGVTINSVSVMSCSSGTLTATITNNTITWFGTSSSGWGIIRGGETAIATVNVSIPAGFAGNLPLPYTLNGDEYNSAPHTLSDTFILTQDSPPVEWLNLNTSSGILAPGASTQITANFSAVGMAEGSYSALISIASNDPVHPITQLDAILEVIDASNHPPEIDLPESFSFDKNGSLQIDMALYVSDIDGDPLTIQILGGSNVQSDINGLLVTLSAIQNWVGTETLTFIVSDGELSASDQGLIKVLPVDTPNWEPVLYPNNPATIYANVTIDSYPAQSNDMLAAFVGNECRGLADIVLSGSVAYATILVQLSQPNETIYFRVYSYAADTIYDSQTTVQAEFGEEIGIGLPLEIDAGVLSYLQQPELQISQSGTGFLLSWQPILHADYYEVYYSDTPDGVFQLLATTTAGSHPINASQNRAFFKVKAHKGMLSK